ncbi:MAG: DNA alkylation repair protein [Bacteroidales bacterium]
MNKTRSDILRQLKTLVLPCDNEYKEFNARIVFGNQVVAKRQKDNILGVRIPAIRNLAKTLVKKEDWKKILEAETAEATFLEEKSLIGILIGSAKMPLNERLKWYKKFMPMIDNWAVNDVTCSTTSWCKKLTVDEKESVWDFLQPYLKSKKEFYCRFAVIMLMTNFLDDQYVDKVLSICGTIAGKNGQFYSKEKSISGNSKTKYPEGFNTPFYVEMGVAWCLATAAAKYPEKTIKFLKYNQLSGRIKKMTAQKSRDSFRISKENKIIISELSH